MIEEFRIQRYAQAPRTLCSACGQPHGLNREYVVVSGAVGALCITCSHKLAPKLADAADFIADQTARE